MNYKQLGKSGLKVSRICLGSNNFGAQIDETAAIKIILKALDLGINIIDTADIYTHGKSEEIIGKALKGRRDDVIIATKVGMNVGQGPNQTGLSRKHILNQIKRSLKSLETDYIDVYYLHRFDLETPLDESLLTLNDLIREGKVRYIACSNFAAWQIAKSYEVCERLDLEKFIAVQPPYNLLQRGIENELLPFCQQEMMGVLTYTPLRGGILTGKYAKNRPPPAGSRAEFNPRLLERMDKNEYSILENIQGVAKCLGVTMSQLAIAWILRNPIVTAPIVGASSPEQVEENCNALEVKIDDETSKTL
ncbi:MAG: Aldo ket red protein [Thermoproteota archaeon]|nr:Aldo ket red protein [Thermoproteota archaeon]